MESYLNISVKKVYYKVIYKHGYLNVSHYINISLGPQ